MMRKKTIATLFITILLFIMLIPFISHDSKLNFSDQNIDDNLKHSANLEGIENVIITDITRIANISSYGLLNVEDRITIKNLNNNPIISIFIGIPLSYSDEFVFFESTGENGNSLLTERSSIIMNDYEMLVIYFDSPLLPHQTRLIKFRQTYNNLFSYKYFDEQTIEFSGFTYPLLPYKIEAASDVIFHLPKESENTQSDWGFVDESLNFVKYLFDDIKYDIGDNYIEPFLENIGDKRYAAISFTISTSTKMEVSEINREIFISPWGIIRVKEDILITNLGIVPINSFSLELVKDAKNIYVSDYLGEILGVTVSKSSSSKTININLRENRAELTPSSSIRFKVQYYLSFEKYITYNWFQESLQIDLLTMFYEFLGRQQTINIIIEGCQNIEDITIPPQAIKNSRNSAIIIYKSDFISPLEKNMVQITFTIDFFNLLFRPILFILLISLIASGFVVFIKLRKKEQDTTLIRKELIPINEIREFCSLYEEKNALDLEIRQAEADAKRKKIAKKNYKNIVERNTSKIDEIQNEIVQFKSILMQTNEIFENIIKKLDVLEAEKMSIKDSLNLLETRYKRGRLPSRAAYLKLSEDFKKRRKKVDRNIDKFIQQLRSYLL